MIKTARTCRLESCPARAWVCSEGVDDLLKWRLYVAMCQLDVHKKILKFYQSASCWQQTHHTIDIFRVVLDLKKNNVIYATRCPKMFVTFKRSKEPWEQGFLRQTHVIEGTWRPCWSSFCSHQGHFSVFRLLWSTHFGTWSMIIVVPHHFYTAESGENQNVACSAKPVCDKRAIATVKNIAIYRLSVLNVVALTFLWWAATTSWSIRLRFYWFCDAKVCENSLFLSFINDC